MEGDHREAAAGDQQPLGGEQSAFQLAQLVVHMHPQRLEGPGRRVPLAAPADGGGNELREFAGAADRPAGAGAQNRPGDGAGAPLLAQGPENTGDVVLVRLVDEIGGARPVVAHPHVEGTVSAEGEATLGDVELRTGHAEVEGHAVDRVDAGVVQ